MGSTLMLSIMRVPVKRSIKMFTSITYSGGQAIEGQGGFYGSGGARASLDQERLGNHASELLALAGDVERVSLTMRELLQMESLLEDEPKDSVSGKNIELRNSIKKMIT